MRYIEVGGVRLSVIGLGTWQFGSREWGYGADYAAHDAVDLVHRALDRGVNLIDTAELYAFGRSERIVGSAIGSRRADAFVATKLLPVLPVGPVIRQRVAGSLRRLGVGQIDLYQAHWPNPVVPPGLLFHTLAALQREGRIAHVGVSNYSLAQWQHAERLLGGTVLSNQVSFSLAEHRPDDGLVGWAADHGRVVIAYSPLAQGFLSGRYGPDHRPSGIRALSPLFLPESFERAADLLGSLRRIAASHGAEPGQVALAWLLRRPNVVVIPGARSVAQLDANLDAADLELSAADDEELTAAARAFAPPGRAAAAAGFLHAQAERARAAWTGRH
jgi:aryl-alcohol dehydrogenase-like predicted oxidoreductase